MCGRRGVCPAPQAGKGCEKTHKDTGRGCQTSQRESSTQRGRERNRDPPCAGRGTRVNSELSCEPLHEKPKVKTALEAQCCRTMLKGILVLPLTQSDCLFEKFPSQTEGAWAGPPEVQLVTLVALLKYWVPSLLLEQGPLWGGAEALPVRFVLLPWGWAGERRGRLPYWLGWSCTVSGSCNQEPLCLRLETQQS